MINKLFTLSDYTNSDDALKQGFMEQFNPSNEVRSNLEILHKNLIIPLLDDLKGNLIITSGFRCKRLNDYVGGVSNSDHLTGCAVDLNLFEGVKKVDDILWTAIKDLKLKYKQIGWEHNGDWLHVSYELNNLKMEVFYA